MMSYQWTSAVLAITIAVTIVWLVRHNHLHARNAIWWVVVAVAVALIGSMPGFVDWVALRLGISYPPTLVVLVGLGVVVYKLLRADIERSKQQQQIRILTQKIAVLEAQICSQKRKQPDRIANTDTDSTKRSAL